MGALLFVLILFVVFVGGGWLFGKSIGEWIFGKEKDDNSYK
jgi:hypothetical protein